MLEALQAFQVPDVVQLMQAGVARIPPSGRHAAQTRVVPRVGPVPRPGATRSPPVAPMAGITAGVMTVRIGAFAILILVAVAVRVGPATLPMVVRMTRTFHDTPSLRVGSAKQYPALRSVFRASIGSSLRRMRLTRMSTARV